MHVSIYYFSFCASVYHRTSFYEPCIDPEISYHQETSCILNEVVRVRMGKLLCCCATRCGRKVQCSSQITTRKEKMLKARNLQQIKKLKELVDEANTKPSSHAYETKKTKRTMFRWTLAKTSETNFHGYRQPQTSELQ